MKLTVCKLKIIPQGLPDELLLFECTPITIFTVRVQNFRSSVVIRDRHYLISMKLFVNYQSYSTTAGIFSYRATLVT